MRTFFLGSGSGSNGTTVAGFTTSGGSSFSELNNPTALALFYNTILYIYDSSNYRVLRWSIGDPLGFVVAGGRGSGTTLDKISTGYGLYVDSQFKVYVSEYGNHRVTMWPNSTIGYLVSESQIYVDCDIFSHA